jgi:hypothetical protein
MIKNLVQNCDRLTTQLLADTLRESNSREPAEFLRLPPPGRQCPITGITRSSLNVLILPCKENGFKPPVRSFSLRQKGRTTGIRLIDRADLVRYVRGHVASA